ncbi:hypothetical protein ON010_g18112 [Phytophthora cinnamomi]|nr:hypothetical protein ON010_g18112 [Phytophthora cinnamomi]
MQALEDLQKEKRERLAAKSRNSVVSIAGAEGFSGLATEPKAVSLSRVSSEATSDMSVDDVHFAMQKLKREVAELKSTNSKLLLTNSQFEDDLAHLQAKFEEEKRAHLNGKKWLADASAIIIIYCPDSVAQLQHLSTTLAAQQDGEDELKRERDRVSLLLSSEIKKIAALTKVNLYLQESERKDRLVTLAMAARYEMVQHANRQEKLAAEACEQRNQLESRVHQAEAEAATLKLQLQDAFERFEDTNTTLSNAKTSIVQLQNEVRATADAATAKEAELLAAFEKQQAAMQQKLDKTKRELMESMSEVLNLDNRLRRAQEKLAKQASGAATR